MTLGFTKFGVERQRGTRWRILLWFGGIFSSEFDAVSESPGGHRGGPFWVGDRALCSAYVGLSGLE